MIHKHIKKRCIKKTIYTLLLSIICLSGFSQTTNPINTIFLNGLESAKFFNVPRYASDPSTTGLKAGAFYFNTSTNNYRKFDGSVFSDFVVSTVPNLQQVTAAGSTTTFGITTSGSFAARTGLSGGGLSITPSGLNFIGTAVSQLSSGASGTTRNWILPDLSGDIALQQNLPFRSLTTTGTNGAATLINGVLNIPQYSGGGTTYTFSNGLTNLSGNVTLGGNLLSPTILGLTTDNYFNISGGSGVSNSGFFNIGAGSGSTNVIGYASMGNSRSISFSNTQLLVSDAIGLKGMEYNADYSANFTARSLVDKAYVDGLIVGATNYWQRSGTSVSPATANDRIYNQVSGAVAIDGRNTSSGQGVSATSSTGTGLYAESGTTNNSGFSTAAPLTAKNTGTTGDIVNISNSSGIKARINNNGIYNYESDPTSNLGFLSAVHKGYVDARIAQLVEVAGTTQSLASGTTYILHSGSLTTCTLPATANVGDLISIIGEGAGGFRVSQNASQFIASGNSTSTVGTGGYIQSTTNNTFVSLRYVNTNKWMVTSSNSAISIF